MKRLLALALLLTVALCCLFGCIGQPKYERETFYGVVKYAKDLERLLIYIPNLGDVEIPDCDTCRAGFDGYDENESNSYTLKAGDLVAIHFKYEKSWDDYGVSVMEMYPAKFDRKASTIEALAENIEFEKIDGGYVLSFPSKEASQEFSEGENVYFVNYSAQNGFDCRKTIAQGKVKKVLDERITVFINDLETPTDFLKYFTYLKLEKAE